MAGVHQWRRRNKLQPKLVSYQCRPITRDLSNVVDWSPHDSVDGEVCETTTFVLEINRLIIINNYLLIAHSSYNLNEKHAASMPTMKDGIDASADWNTAVEDAKCDINVVA